MAQYEKIQLPITGHLVVNNKSISHYFVLIKVHLNFCLTFIFRHYDAYFSA